MNVDHELKQWQAEWQRNPAASLDTDLLLHAAKRRARREKWVAAIEVLSAVMVVLACLTIAVILDLHALERVVFIGLAAVTGGFTLWSFRQRRRHWDDPPMDACALLDIERRRIVGRLRYWRLSIFAVSAILAATVAAAVVSHALELDVTKNWLASATRVLIVLVGTALWFIVVRKQTMTQLKRLNALERGT